jgi:hypothetical protein
MRQLGLSFKKIGKKFNLSGTHIQRIVKGK